MQRRDRSLNGTLYEKTASNDSIDAARRRGFVRFF